MSLVVSVQVQYLTTRTTKGNLSGLLSQQLGGEEIRLYEIRRRGGREGGLAGYLAAMLKERVREKRREWKEILLKSRRLSRAREVIEKESKNEGNSRGLGRTVEEMIDPFSCLLPLTGILWTHSNLLERGRTREN